VKDSISRKGNEIDLAFAYSPIAIQYFIPSLRNELSGFTFTESTRSLFRPGLLYACAHGRTLKGFRTD
jgi:hypothetical protein